MSKVTAYRHVCQEARVLLTSLRGGPPSVARGDLAQDLVELRHALMTTNDDSKHNSSASEDGEGYADKFHQGSDIVVRPFLQVVMDPRAAGPQTLVALRSMLRLLEVGAFDCFDVPLQGVMQGVLACKFEQTDADADEAVEMAIADVLSFLVQKSSASTTNTKEETGKGKEASSGNDNAGGAQEKPNNTRLISPEVLIDSFNTVFVTRNTFVHSPALCYHFEDVLTAMVSAVFGHNCPGIPPAQVTLFEFLVNHLLHTPLVAGGSPDSLDESTREAQIAHDATRILCLRLARTALQSWIGNQNDSVIRKDDPVLQIIRDDLCLSLLMTGQSIWAYHDAHTSISTGYISLEVLTEICTSISLLWNMLPLRLHLVAQFETIFTGFYTRALVLLRQRKHAQTSINFNANLVFDAEVEIILESLVDILCLHDHCHSILDGDGGSLETMFVFYDCHLRRSDVASGLMTELCRCCGGTVNEDGDFVVVTRSSSYTEESNNSMENAPGEPGTPPPTPIDGASSSAVSMSTNSSMIATKNPWRLVPPHLKELCAQALIGGMKCLFRDDKASDETMRQRAERKRSIMLRQVDPEQEVTEPNHQLNDIKSKKRLMRKAARIFNKHASRGIEFLIDSGLVADPVTPESVATFLRDGIVVGLDKKAVGAYLGEAGKAPVAGKSPASWERDWFHKDVLKIYCSLFDFEGQSLLDGLRMFLAAFRLPGEAQQIDRILQAFADSCGQVCEESANGNLKLFSDDPKRASDAAYLLSFSIIMLNTDRHNNNIREDRKMSCDDFVKNNTDYGRDITEKGKEFPREFLESIYVSIRDEEIRTEGEGADGAMTVERWKDVLRGSAKEPSPTTLLHPSVNDAEDLTELVLEHVWKPIMSAIGALWGIRRDDESRLKSQQSTEASHGGMLGAQGARLGMDMALEMLRGVRTLGRIDVFRKIFSWVCDYTGLLGDYTSDVVDRTWALAHSVEAQSAVVVALETAAEAGEDLDEECWKRVWAIIFEMRDLKLVPLRSVGPSESILHESDNDLLSESARREWTMCLIKGDMNFDSSGVPKQRQVKVGLLGAFGRALFGSEIPGEPDSGRSYEEDASPVQIERTAHGKEDLVVWDECAVSDDEEETTVGTGTVVDTAEEIFGPVSQGTKFESMLIRESIDLSKQMDMPVTGLERVDETRNFQNSPRARVRERIRSFTDLKAIISDSRFMDDEGILNVLKSLTELIISATRPPLNSSAPLIPPRRPIDCSASESSFSSGSFAAPSSQLHVPLSPASEAFAEVLLCEIAIKNKDRLKTLWDGALQDHYVGQLSSLLVTQSEGGNTTRIPVNPGLEKRITGLLRISICALKREGIADDVLSAWKFVLPRNADQHAVSPLRILDRHFGEGLWRMASDVDYLQSLGSEGWDGLVALLNWCANRGGYLKPVRYHDIEGRPAFGEDDPALQAYRSLHLIINTNELVGNVPESIVESLVILVHVGERREYSQLSVATLDLFSLLLEKRLESLEHGTPSKVEEFWSSFWRKIVEGIAQAAEKASDTVGFVNSEVRVLCQRFSLNLCLLFFTSL